MSLIPTEMIEPRIGWELVQSEWDHGMVTKTFRLKVSSGWLYKSTTAYVEQTLLTRTVYGAASESMVFVPNETHEEIADSSLERPDRASCRAA